MRKDPAVFIGCYSAAGMTGRSTKMLVCAGEACAVEVFQRSLDEGISLLERRWAVANDKKGRTITGSAFLLYFATYF